MKLLKIAPAVLLFATTIFSIPSICAGQTILGNAPQAPTDVSQLPGGGARPKTVTGGFTVDASSREQVREFYNAIYFSGSGVPMDSTEDILNCAPGTTSAAYKEIVLRRINWFRALAGLPAAVTLNDDNNANDQAAALMMSANNQLSHMPPNSWSCWSINGSNAASMSNLALGNSGADAITAYIKDFGANNPEVGHRRWILYPQTQIMGTGDVPATNGFLAANATWVFDSNYFGPRPPTRTPFVSWPPAGYVPYSLVSPQWSFAMPQADFSGTTVTLKSNGVPVAISFQSYVGNIGEDTLVWYPSSLNPADADFPFNGADTTYTVTVSNVLTTTGPQDFNYTVTLFDPAIPGADYFPPTISGPSQPAINSANAYTFTGLTNATGYQWRSAQLTNGNLSDGAEGGLNNFNAITSPGYSVITNGLASSGTHAFYLAQPQPVDQILQLNPILLPTNNFTVSFKSLLGYATTNQIAEFQISPDGGANWNTLYSLPGNDSQTESAYHLHTFSLSSYSGQVVSLRFNYHIFITSSYSTFSQISVNPPVGWFIDDILITNAQKLVNLVTNSIITTNFTFTPTQTGNYILQTGGIIFTEFPLGFGPAKLVTAIVGPPIITLNTPTISGNQVQLNFTVSGAASTFKLLQTDQLNGIWTTNSSAILTTNVPGSSYRFTTTTGPATRFYRIQSP